ncbi:hypothetical protein V7O66_06585 [Methanolobus sp. ZRKC3]|uniref:hypothetical protein n=1 Tax=Methanolobus sp. ZRKC3 TaxID=3125786 RepID=UPI003251399F
MIHSEIKRRLAAIEEKKNRGDFKAFMNIDHELDAQIEQYKQEHPHDELMIIEVVNPNAEEV